MNQTETKSIKQEKTVPLMILLGLNTHLVVPSKMSGGGSEEESSEGGSTSLTLRKQNIPKSVTRSKIKHTEAFKIKKKQ